LCSCKLHSGYQFRRSDISFLRKSCHYVSKENYRLAGICCFYISNSHTNLWWEWSWVHEDFSWQYGDDTAPSSHLTGESYTCWASSGKSCSVSRTLHIVQKMLHLTRANRTTDLVTMYILAELKYSTRGNFFLPCLTWFSQPSHWAVHVILFFFTSNFLTFITHSVRTAEPWLIIIQTLE